MGRLVLAHELSRITETVSLYGNPTPPPPRPKLIQYIVEHPNQEGDTCIDWTSQYCWTNGWNCLWRGHSVYRNRPLIPKLIQSIP